MSFLSKLRLEPLSMADAHWLALRRPARHDDEALTGTTRVWLRRLPASRRPLRLCEHFPRVANRLAWHWRDPAQAREVLDDLLVDRRGGRSGFPREVAQELRRLRGWLDGLPDEPPSSGVWGAWRQFWARH